MSRQAIQFKSTSVLIIFMSLFLDGVADMCNVCFCSDIWYDIDCSSRQLISVPKGIVTMKVDFFLLSHNSIGNIEKGVFQQFTTLKKLDLAFNNIRYLKKEIFQQLTHLEELDLSYNEITNIEEGTFNGLSLLKSVNLSYNSIQKLEDGIFFFLPSIMKIDIRGNNITCGCYQFAQGEYMKKVFKRTRHIISGCNSGNCSHSTSSTVENWLFQSNLQCQTCSEMVCGNSEVTTCPGKESVCMTTKSMNGVAMKFEKSCRTYKECVEGQRNNSVTCQTWTSGAHCVACCRGNRCNKQHFLDLTNSFKFRLVYTYSNSTSQKWKFNERKQLSTDLEREFLTLKGMFKVEYCGLEENREIFTIRCTVLKENSVNEVWDKINNILVTSQTLRSLGIQQHSVKLIHEMVCSKNTMSTKHGTFQWPVTKTGTTATLICRANIATRDCFFRTQLEIAKSNMTSTNCTSITGIWQEPDMSQCYNTEWITKQEEDMKNRDINKENIEAFTDEFLNVSRISEYFRVEHVDLSVSILEKMKPFILNASTNTALDNALLSINNLINIPEEIWSEAEQASSSVSRILNVIKTIQEKIPLKKQQVTSLYSNFGIGVAKVEKDTFNGLVYDILYGTNETETRNMIHNASYKDKPQGDIEMMNFISLPKNLKHIKEEQWKSFSRILFLTMKDDKLYRAIGKYGNETNTKINSHIIAANIPNIPISNLDEPVIILFSLINQNAIKPQCVYWDDTSEQNPHWSTKGCKVFNYQPGQKVFCSCTHLTSFALVMDIYNNEENINAQYLSIISNVGCGISFVCLILTMIIYVYFKNLWKLMASKILVSLSISLAITNLIFLVGFQSYIGKVTAVCKTVAAMLHYFLLTSLMWMSVEAFHVFLNVVIVFKAYEASFMLRSSIVAWGLPAVIVIITLIVNYSNNYIRKAQVCWLTTESFYAAFLCPVVIILLFNLTMFSFIMWRIYSIQNCNKFNHKDRKVRVLGILGLVFLFGLSWILAFFTFNKVAEVFKILFAIFNTLQGMFIFIFYCIYKKDARDLIYQFVYHRKNYGLWKTTEDRKNSNFDDKGTGQIAETKLDTNNPSSH